MITSKQRATLRGIANTTRPIFQIGKAGITEDMLVHFDEALEARELIKITLLETAPMTAREACEIVCAAVGAEPVQTIGRKFAIYRESKEHKTIEL